MLLPSCVAGMGLVVDKDTDKLEPYRRKRDFARTSEPRGALRQAAFRFVVHKHAATHDHYDLRLELDGVLKSWAVPKGPSLDPADKRFAAQTEDHPIDYIDFEGVIPAGQYGGGPMIVWDSGSWAPMGDPQADMAKGSFKFRLVGQKLRGGWMLTRLKARQGETDDKGWLLFKEHDQFMDTGTDILQTRPESVKSGRRIEELVAPAPALSHRKGKPQPGRLAGAVKAPMPDTMALQLASPADRPPQHRPNMPWLHEIKFDGYRTLAMLDHKAVRLLTRGGLDWTGRYGDLPLAFAALPCRRAVIDGEIVVLDDKGISRFGMLQNALSEGARNSLVFYAFDLLYLDGWDLRAVPLTRRKAMLAQVLADHGGARSPIQYSDHVEGSGDHLYELASLQGLEGIVSKRADGRYVAGRSTSWLKVKALRTGDYVIAGYTESVANGGIGALGMAEWVDGDLIYRGKVGTGFDAATMKNLHRRLEDLRSDQPVEGAPRDVVPVRPVLIARIQYATLTADGQLRHATFKGLREAELTTAMTGPRQRIISDADLAGIWVTNPTRRLFGKNGPTKLDIAIYYAAVGDYMLPHLFNRPVSLYRCPTGKEGFFQRHPFTGMPAGMARFDSTNSEGENQTYIAVETARAYLALPQFGVVEFHAWGTHQDHIDRPDRVIFDLDPGEGIEWRDVVNAAVHLRGELAAMGLVPFVKTSGGKGVHIVIPTTRNKTWKQTHAACAAIAGRLAASGPDTFVTTMGAENRKARIFIDYHRNARSATAVAAYSLRARSHLPVSTPIDWRDLESIDSPQDLNYSSIPRLLTTSGDPWADINQSARDLPA